MSSLMLTADPVPLCYFFGKQICSFKCFIFRESHPILMTRFVFSDHLCTVRESAWQNFMRHTLLDSGKVHGKIRLLTVNSFPIYSFKFIHLFRVALLWSFLVLMGGKTDGQDLFLTKTIGFDFLLFNYMLLSVWIRVQTFNSLLINWIGSFIL